MGKLVRAGWLWVPLFAFPLLLLISSGAFSLSPAKYYIVQFEPDSIELTTKGMEQVRDFAMAHRSYFTGVTSVEGYMDEEEASGTLDVAWQRTQVVINALGAYGMDRGRIVSQAFRPKPTDRSNWPKLTPARDYEDRRLTGGHAVEIRALPACNAGRC